MKKSKYGLSLKPNRDFLKALIVTLAVVLVWRGVWNLLDMYFLPDMPIVTNTIGIAVGIMLLYLPDGDIKELV